MGLRIMLRDLRLEPPKRIGGNYVEGPLLISYSLREEKGDCLSEARFFLQYDGSRIPLAGNDNDLCALLYDDPTTAETDLYAALEALGEPTKVALLEQFSTQRHRKPIEHELKKAAIVKVVTSIHAASAAVPYEAIALRRDERSHYARVVESILSGLAAGQAAIDVAVRHSLPGLEEAAEGIATTYTSFLGLVKKEAGQLEDMVSKIAAVGSTIKRNYDNGFLPLAKYKEPYENLQLAMLRKWAHPLLTAIELGVAALNISLFEDKSLDKERFGAVAVLNQEAWKVAKAVYSPRFRDEAVYADFAELYEASATISVGLAGHALNLQKAFEALTKQREKLAVGLRGEARKIQTRKARRLVGDVLETVESNRKIFLPLPWEGNPRKFDLIKELFLGKIAELENAAHTLQRDYSL